MNAYTALRLSGNMWRQVMVAQLAQELGINDNSNDNWVAVGRQLGGNWVAIGRQLGGELNQSGIAAMSMAVVPLVFSLFPSCFAFPRQR